MISVHFHFGFPDNFSSSILNENCCGMKQNYSVMTEMCTVLQEQEYSFVYAT